MVSRVSRKVLTVLLVFVSILLLSSCSVNNYHEHHNHFYGTSDDPKINEVFQILQENYYENLPLNLSQIESVDEIFNFTDRYTFTYETDSRSIDAGTSYVGLGVTIQDHPEGLLVTNVNLAIEANKDIFPGDIITHINDQAIKNFTFANKTLKLKGDLGDEKKLKIKRIELELTITLELVTILTPSITYEYLADDNIGLIKIDRFEGDTDEYFNSALTALEAQGMKHLIIDVRDNGGGYLNATLNILDNFVYGNDPYLYTYYVKANYTQSFKPTKSSKKPYGITTLINGSSASASEMLAATLMQFDYNSFGERSYGKDLFQGGKKLTTMENTNIQFTMGYWILKDETTVRGGITPSIEHIETGVRMYNQPTLNKIFKQGDATSELMVYQYLISQKVSGTYEFGLFDNNFKQMVETYQQQNSLEVNGILDELTQVKLIEYYRELITDSNYDNLLNEAIKYVNEN